MSVPGPWQTARSTELSIVVPILDEEDCIPELYRRLKAALSGLGRPYEIIAVDDGSTDGSFALLRELAARDPSLRVVRLRRNFGQTAAFCAGFAQARGSIIVTIDGDLQNDPDDIPRVLKKLDEGFDVVSGWRVERRDPLLSRRLPSRVANRLISKSTGIALHDYGCSLKAYRAEVLRDVPLYGELHRFVPAIASWQGIAVAEIPVSHAARSGGRSKYGLGRTIRVLLDLVTVRFLLSYSTRPMQIFGLFGAVMMSLGASVGLYLTGLKLLTGATLADRPLLLVAVLLVVVGVQVMGIGLVGELIVRLQGQPGVRPPYVIREELNVPPTGGGSRGSADT
ncbi:MAG: glycosyltransferase family 2 protein [Acidimicrobiales bacterium]